MTPTHDSMDGGHSVIRSAPVERERVASPDPVSEPVEPDVARRSSEAAFGALDAMGDELGRRLASPLDERRLADAWAGHWLEVQKGPRLLLVFHHCGPSCAPSIVRLYNEVTP